MSRRWQWFHRWGSPPYVFRVGRRWQIGFGLVGFVLVALGWIWGLAFAPVDYQQGNSYRIIFLHVPVAFLAQSLYIGVAVAGVVLLVWKMKLADAAIQAALPVGAILTFLALATGAIWGKPPGVPIGFGMRVSPVCCSYCFCILGQWHYDPRYLRCGR